MPRCAVTITIPGRPGLRIFRVTVRQPNQLQAHAPTNAYSSRPCDTRRPSANQKLVSFLVFWGKMHAPAANLLLVRYSGLIDKSLHVLTSVLQMPWCVSFHSGQSCATLSAAACLLGDRTSNHTSNVRSNLIILSLKSDLSCMPV